MHILTLNDGDHFDMYSISDNVCHVKSNRLIDQYRSIKMARLRKIDGKGNSIDRLLLITYY
ncbi:hypothetical protein GCM10007971_09870 [Oceanobacillus indicireducens]|uniref:Uncharacterized protein n=1 Tax=Oceanobacillus indicireducens TaxID=1004261 RepID=A0A918D013_9BACI|nr:hypothetical protein GCM10007971_09870 [Oceanobacillus indicireducens]